MHPTLNIDHATLAQFCQAHRIRRLALFGSLEGHRQTGKRYRRKVDLRTPQDLSRYFRDEVVRTAEVQYVAG